MNPDIPIEQLLTSICKKFAHSRKLFGNSDLAIALEGRRLSDDEIEAVIQSIERNSDVTVTVVALKDRFFERIFGTSAYADIEVKLQIKYNLTYYKAMEVLYYTNNQKYIYKL